MYAPRTMRRWRAALTAVVALTMAGTHVPSVGAAPRIPVSVDCSMDPALTISTPGRYVLSGPPSLNCPASTGILINSAGVDLDLAGELLDGVDGSASVGILGVAGVTVRNGSVKDFAEGIRNDFGDISLYDLTVTSMLTWGITLGPDSIIRGCTITNNTDYAVRADSADSILIANNTIAGNGAGIRVGSMNRIIGNTITGNGGVGIEAQGENIIRRNRVKGHASHGMTIGGPNNEIRRNRANDNGGHGLNVPGDTGTVISRNIANRNGQRGISAGPNVRGRDNRARGNALTPQCDPARLC